MSATNQINLADIILGPPKRPVVPARVASLAESIFRIGVLQPVILDEGKNLLAGRHRYLACQKLGMTQIPYTTPEKVKSSYSARLAVLSENLYREELTALQRSEWVEEYEKLTDEMDNFETAPGAPRTTKQKAEAIGMSERTLQECKQIASKLAPEVKQALEGTEVADSQKQLLQLARMTPEQQAEAVEKIMRGEAASVHVAHNSGNNEWYTPPEFIEAARRCMGSIDTDPASSDIAQQTVKAGQYFTAEQDGLTQAWSGNVFLNPPYSHPLMGQFAEAVGGKFVEGEISQAVVMINNATETDHFQMLLMAAAAVCFPDGRVKFHTPEGGPLKTPLQGQALLYFGHNPAAFKAEFAGFGAVLFTESGIEQMQAVDPEPVKELAHV